MLKKIFIILFCLNFLQSCGYTPMHSNSKQFKINFEKIDFSGDWELNNFLEDSLKRYKSNEGIKYRVKVNSIYTKNSATKDSSGNTTTYQINIEANINIASDNFDKNFLFKEKFTMENFSDELSQKNYERSNKRNIANIIVNKFITQLSFL